MDKGSEAYSMTKFLFSIAINEDSLQYEALGDTLPEKVKRIKNNGEEQTLKITYSPILENDICKNIMLVIEDISVNELLVLLPTGNLKKLDSLLRPYFTVFSKLS